ncbi:MAG: FAD-binding oxidoreductase [Rhodothermaceae bacterium]|nr:FAD-binding oxidoreductase [Rhodothermaceae bacterium]
MTTSFWQQSDQVPPISCDIAIIGGGIIGTSTAYWIKRLDPSCNVVLLDAHAIGFGASGRNAGFLLQGTSSNYATGKQTFGDEVARALWRFTHENRALVGEHANAARINLGESGSLLVSGTESEQDALERSAEFLIQEGVPAELWDTTRLEASCKAQGFYGALYVASGASMNPIRLLQEIAGQSGANILEHHAVLDITYHGNHCQISTHQRQIRAERVFIALNAYLPQLLPDTAKYVHPIRAQMLASTPQTTWLPVPIYSHEGYYYIRQAPDGSVLLGGARHLFKEEEVGYGDATTPHLQEALEQYYKTHFTEAPPLSVAKRWSGTMAFTPDGLPLFSEAEGLPGSFWAAGFNGHGMGYGFRFGKLMANVFNNKDEDSYYRNLFHKSRLSSIIKLN